MIVDGRRIDDGRGVVTRVMERAAMSRRVRARRVSHRRRDADDECRRGDRRDDRGLCAIAMPAHAVDAVLRIEAEGAGHERAAEIDGDVHDKRDEQQRPHAHAARRARATAPRASATRAPMTFTATVSAKAISMSVISPPR